MSAQAQRNLIRKQYLVSESNIKKLAVIATQKNTSSAEIVRLAIDAYEYDNDVSMSELMELVSSRLKDAISTTKRANQKITSTLEKLEQTEVH